MPRNKELEIAYQILGGIPDEQINLNSVIWEPGKTVKGRPFCGTIACGIGWLLMHPRYKRRGFGVRCVGHHNMQMKTPNRPNWNILTDFVDVASEMFGLNHYDADYIFGTYGRYDKSHKAILLARIRAYLES